MFNDTFKEKAGKCSTTGHICPKEQYKMRLEKKSLDLKGSTPAQQNNSSQRNPYNPTQNK